MSSMRRFGILVKELKNYKMKNWFGNIRMINVIAGFALSVFSFLVILLGENGIELDLFDAIYFLVFIPLLGYHVGRLFFDE